MDTCARCGTPAADQARFCTECGAALSRVAEAPPVRKHVVVVFVDIVGSTALGERLDPESLRRYIKRYFDTASAALWRHGGAVEKFIGDAVMAVFGVPVAREDDAVRAVRAAVELRAAVATLSADLEREYGQRLQVRIGVNGGEVFVARNADGQFSVTGDTVNTAARLEQAAGPGEILVGGTVTDLAAAAVPLVPVTPLSVKGKSEALPAWRVANPGPLPRSARPRASRVELVGRTAELARLRRIAERVARDRAPHQVTLLGSAGIGKSRLVDELLAGLDDWRVLEGSCPSYPAGSTFWPLSLMLEQLGEQWPAHVGLLLRDDRDASAIVDRLATAVGASDEATSLDDIVWAARRLVEALATDRPVLLVFDDLHWASPTFLEFVGRLGTTLRSGPVLVICLSRPELLQDRPAWGHDRRFASTIQLDRLPEAAVRQLVLACGVDVVAHDADVALVDRVTAVSEGNPLVVQQLLRTADRDLPASLATLFQARMDRLDPADRMLCQCGAVVGREFWAAAARYAAELDAPAGEEWLSTLERLARLDIVERTRARNGGRPDHRFTHSLLMESIYRATPKSQRAQAHQRIADWLETAPGLGPGERSELVAHHRDRAHAMLIEVSPGDPQAGALAAAAGEAALRATAACLARSDLPAAARLLARAQALLPGQDTRQYDVSRWLFECLTGMGAWEQAATALDRADEVLADDPMWRLVGPVPRAALDLRLGRCDGARAHAVAGRVIETPGCPPGLLLWAYELDALAYSLDMEMVPAQAAAQQALDYARAAGDRRAESRLRCGLCEMAFWGPTPVSEARVLCQDSVANSGSDLLLTAPALAMLAALATMEGADDTAGELLGRAYQIGEELDNPGLWVGLRQYAYLVYSMRGEHAAAARECRATMGQLSAQDPTSALFQLMAARAHAAAGDLRTAAELFGSLDGRPAPGDPHYQGMWSGLGARLAAHDGDGERARALAQQAVTVAAAMQSPISHGDALMDLAAVQATLGDDAAGRGASGAARELYRRKGATALAAGAGVAG